jgi:uncharacterized protein (TIGR02996 family)
MSPEQGFQQDITDHPGDPAPRLVYADWLEEQGRSDEAFCQRWLVRHGKHPGNRSRPRIQARYSWAWWPEKTADDPDAPRHARLPQLLYLALPKASFFVSHRYYPSREAAETALRLALSTLRAVLAV